MRAIVVGAGEVGFEIARILAMEQHDVVVVDTDPDALSLVEEKLDVLTIRGSGTSASVLEQAGIRQAHMMIAVAAIDEVNIIGCMLAARLGVKTTVARVRSSELTREDSVLQAHDFGIDRIIHPEESAAAEVVRLIRRASATDVLTFADGRLHLVGMRLDATSPAIGRTLSDIVSENPDYMFRIMAIGRGIRTILPRGDTILRKNDQVFVLARPKMIPHVIRIMGKSNDRIENVMVLGGTQLGERIAAELSERKGNSIKLFEPNRERAEQTAARLPNVLVLHGDPTDIDLLVREGLSEMDALVAVTDSEESNLVTCLMAKHLEVSKTVALLSKGGYIPISQSIGLDAAVSAKLAVSREILRFLRGKHVSNVATIHGLDAEILDINAQRKSPITRKPLKDLKLPAGMYIGAVRRGKQVMIATGDTQLEAGDCATTFVLPGMLATAQRMFTR